LKDFGASIFQQLSLKNRQNEHFAVENEQTQLGHSSPTITLNVYAHLMKPANQDAVCRLENTFFGATVHKMVTKSERGHGQKP